MFAHRGTKAIWMQLGLANAVAANKAKARGVKVVMNRCMKIEHTKMVMLAEDEAAGTASTGAKL